MPEEQSTRDRVRALVREVLNNALPEEEGGDASHTATPTSSSASAAAPPPQPSATTGPPPPRPIINATAQVSRAAAADEKPIARDESAKTVITEAEDGKRVG